MPYRWDIETLRQSDLLGDGNGAEAVGGDNVPHVSLKPLAFEWAGAMVQGHVEQYWAVFRSRERNCLMLHGISWVSSIFGFVCTLFAHFCGVPFLWSFRSEVKLSRLSHRVMKSHYFKHAEQQANWLHLSARNADALEQERTIAICNPTSLYPLCQKSYKAIVVLPVHVTEEIRPQHGIAEELWFHQRKQSEKTPDFCSMEIASADVPWPELAALSGAWKDKNIMRSMMRSWWEIII